MTTGRDQGSQGSIPENSLYRSVKSSPASPRRQSAHQARTFSHSLDPKETTLKHISCSSFSRDID
jgi:hypothetical protein